MTAGIRGSTYLLGAMLARFGRAALRGSGGCDLGERPIDQHLLGFERLGAAVVCTQDGVFLEATGLHGASIALAMPSVGATANLLLAAVTAEGKTVIQNAAADPHVDALIDFLISAGASISREDGCLCVLGVPRLRGVACRIIPDMIEAGTYLCMGMACGGTVRVRNVCPSHLEALLCCLRRMGARPECGKNYVTLTAPREYACTAVTTGPYPAFPTDLHPPLTVLLSRTAGGVICDLVWHDRFSYVEELKKMGLCAASAKGSVRVWQSRLQGCSVTAPDLRGGAALVTAALIAEGESRIAGERLIARGYEDFAEKLYTLGADIRIVPEG
jgi:UDP-N-acetylglucosamine 1-carboxyvinyltransferase